MEVFNLATIIEVPGQQEEFVGLVLQIEVGESPWWHQTVEA